MLEERPFSSCRVLCYHFQTGKATRVRILHDELGFKIFHVDWVLHDPSVNQKSETVSYSKLLLMALME
jgi:hypothetical protein